MTEQEYSIENDPLFKPISDEKKKVIDEAVERHVRSLTLDENVSKDEEKLSGQNYALISIVSPESGQKAENICLKIKGVFASLDEANKHAEMLQKLDATFDIFVVEMYSWLLVPPDSSLIEQKHVDQKLNEIIGGHRESQLKAKEYFNERKRELMDNIVVENERRKEENKKLAEAIEEVEEAEAIEEVADNNVNDNDDPQGIVSASTVNICDNGDNCPNSAPTSTPSELMDKMINDDLNVEPKKSWADKVEENN